MPGAAPARDPLETAAVPDIRPEPWRKDRQGCL